MTLLTKTEIFLLSLVACIVVALIVQLVWIAAHGDEDKPKAGNLAIGVGMTGAITAIPLFFCLLYFLPSVYIVDSDDYSTRRFISADWPQQLTGDYIMNQSGHDLRFVAVGYGTQKDVDMEVEIPKGALKRVASSIDGYNTQPPQSIRSKSSGATKWYLYTVY